MFNRTFIVGVVVGLIVGVIGGFFFGSDQAIRSINELPRSQAVAVSWLR